MAPFGRAVIYGAKNAHDSFPTERVRQLIFKNQSVTGFNFPSLLPEQIGESVSALVELINGGQVKLFANHAFGLADVRKAFEVATGTWLIKTSPQTAFHFWVQLEKIHGRCGRKLSQRRGSPQTGADDFVSCESTGVCYEARRFVLSRSWQRSMHIGRRSRSEEAKGMWGLLCRTKKSIFVSH